MIDYLYGYIIPVSSKLNRFQEAPNHLKEQDKPVPEGGTQPFQKWENKLNQPQKCEPRGGPVE